MERKLHTKQQLADSLKDIMKTKPFRKITVQNVTDHCGLNRQTFYYHFKDIYQLLEWIYQNEMFQKVIAPQDQNWQKTMLDVLKYAKQNKTFLRNINRSLRKETIEKFLYPILYQWMEMLFDDVCRSSAILQEDRLFLLDFFTQAFVNCLIHWIGNGMQEKEADLLKKAELIRSMLSGLTDSNSLQSTMLRASSPQMIRLSGRYSVHRKVGIS